MRATLVIVSVCLLAAAPAPKPDLDQARRDFETASERALAGDPKGAIALYRSLLDRGVVNEDIYFNMGNVLAESGQLVDATIAYERALRLAPNDAEAQVNLQAVRKKLGRKEPSKEAAESSSAVGLVDLIEPVLAPIPGGPVSIVLAVSNALLFGLLLLRRFTAEEHRRRAAGQLAVLALVLAVASGVITAGHHLVRTDPRAVSLEARDLKEGPHPRFGTRGRVEGGERVRVMKEEAGWIEVLGQDGQRGWLPVNAAERI